MKTKRWMLLLLCLLLALAFVPAAARAEEYSGQCGADLYWSFNKSTGKLTITGSGDMDDFHSYAPWYSLRAQITYVSLPNGLSRIGGFAFVDCTGLTSVTIPSSVTSIGSNAFASCTGLTSIAIPSSGVDFDSGVFQGCTGLTSVPNGVRSFGAFMFYGCTGLKSVAIPNGVSAIGYHTFENCTGLKSVTIPSSVTSIGSYTFANCTGLTSVTIPDSVTWIGESAFSGCTGLTSVTIPNSVTTIDVNAFSGTGLTSVTIPNRVQTIRSGLFSCCHGLKSITIPFGVTSIEDRAFSWCEGLTSITIPSSVTSIGGYAFDYCSGLTSITIPNSVTSIGEWAFWGCSGLTSVTIPSSVTCINDSTYCNCTGLTSVTIPNSVTSIGESAFLGCTGLTSVTIPNSVTSIGESAFGGTGLKSVTIPSSVTSVGERAFQGCWGLTSVTIPNSVTCINDYTFAYTGLTSVTIPNSVTSIGNHVFEECTGLTSITIPNSITSIGYVAFSECSSLKTVNYQGTEKDRTEIEIGDGNDELLNATWQYSSGTAPTITTQPKSVTVAVNATAKFTVAATNATSYQWQWSADNGKTWSNSSSVTTGYNTATLQVTATAARNGYQYRCLVTNRAGTVTSGAATLTVDLRPTITTQPSNKTVSVGSTATFKVVASNAAGYQWQWSADSGKTWSNSSSATTGYNTATLQVTATAARNGYQYRCKVSNSAGTVTSNAATLTVDLRPTITTQPTDKTVSAGSTATFKVVASNATGYQWQWSFDGGNNWYNSSSATVGYNTATLQVTATEARNGYMYRCEVSNSAGTVTSSAATLTVVTKPTITTQPKSVTAAVNATAKFTVAASGTGLKYQWQWSFDGGKNWQNSSSATTGYNTATLQVTATEARNGYQYRCQVTNEAGAVTSSAATLTVSSSKPTITTQPKSVTAAVNTTAKFTVEATNATSYQWQWSFDGGSNWQNSSSATTGYNTATLQVTATETRNGYMYRCKVTNSAGTVTSSAATLTVVTKPTITTQPKSVTTSAGSTAKFTVAASGTGLKYQWQWSFDGGNNWQNSSSATTGYNTATLQVTATEARNGYMYRCKVTNSAGTVYTNAVTLTVK